MRPANLPFSPARLRRRLVLALASATVVLAAVAVPAHGARWTRPVPGAVSRPFAYGADPFRPGWHRGVDLAATPGTPVRAPCTGQVLVARRVAAAGRVVTLRCGPWRVTHLPLAGLAVRKGAWVPRGDPLGIVAAAREHAGLHLGVRRAGNRFAYVDPMRFVSGGEGVRPPTIPGGRRGAAADGRPRARARASARTPAAVRARAAARGSASVRPPAAARATAGRLRRAQPGPPGRARACALAGLDGAGITARRARRRCLLAVPPAAAGNPPEPSSVGYGEAGPLRGGGRYAAPGNSSSPATIATGRRASGPTRSAVTSGSVPAIGAAVAIVDTLYATAGAAGAARVLAIEPLRLASGLVGAAVFGTLGARTLWSAFRVRMGGEADAEAATPRRAFLTALGATASNPLTIASWAAIFTAASTAGADRGALLLGGVGLGSLSWMTLLATGVTLARRRIGDRVLGIVDLLAGTALIRLRRRARVEDGARGIGRAWSPEDGAWGIGRACSPEDGAWGIGRACSPEDGARRIGRACSRGGRCAANRPGVLAWRTVRGESAGRARRRTVRDAEAGLNPGRRARHVVVPPALSRSEYPVDARSCLAWRPRTPPGANGRRRMPEGLADGVLAFDAPRWPTTSPRRSTT